MRYSLDLYRRFISVNMRAQMQYRTAFLLDLLGTGIGTAAAFGTLALILQRFGHIGGWTLPEIAFLYGTVETAFGLTDMIFSGFDPGVFGQQVRRGTFDQILLRPVNATLQVLGSDFALRRLARIAQGAFVLGYALLCAGIHWTAPKALFVPVIVASLVCFFGALFIVGSTITFWTVESIEAINMFTYGGVEMMSYPMSVYHTWLRRFLPSCCRRFL
jgi:ABC-2 type transport system permease protein